MSRFKRVVLYVNPEKYRKLKSILALKGETLSNWLRKKIEKEVDD
jgi:hypothetical protein